MNDTPCKGCDKRHAACHGSCEDYISFQEELKESNQAYRNDKEKSFILGTNYDRAKRYKAARIRNYLKKKKGKE